MTALRLQENCDDHAKKKKKKNTHEKRLEICAAFLCGLQRKWQQLTTADVEIHPPAATNHSRSRARIPGIN